MYHPISIRRDPRFSIKKNWEIVADAVQEAKLRGILVTPITVLHADGGIEGWHLDGWKSPPGQIIYEATPALEYVPNWVI